MALWQRCGDACDNALAETISGLCKTELIRRDGPWKGIDDVEYATLEWLDWFNHCRPLEPIGDIPPAEYEAAYWAAEACENTDRLKQSSLQPNPGRFRPSEMRGSACSM